MFIEVHSTFSLFRELINGSLDFERRLTLVVPLVVAVGQRHTMSLKQTLSHSLDVFGKGFYA